MEEIAVYVQRERGPGVASSVASRIYSVFDILAATPGTLGTHRDDLLPGLRTFPSPPNVIYFLYEKDAVWIARVLHERRDAARELAKGFGRRDR